MFGGGSDVVVCHVSGLLMIHVFITLVDFHELDHVNLHAVIELLIVDEIHADVCYAETGLLLRCIAIHGTPAEVLHVAAIFIFVVIFFIVIVLLLVDEEVLLDVGCVELHYESLW